MSSHAPARSSPTSFDAVDIETVSKALEQFGDQIPVAAILQAIKEEQAKKNAAVADFRIEQSRTVLLQSPKMPTDLTYTYIGGHSPRPQDQKSKERRRRLIAELAEAFPSGQEIPVPISLALLHADEHAPSTQAETIASSCCPPIPPDLEASS